MKNGYAVHIGLNSVDSGHYKTSDGKPWGGELNGAENDAAAMKKLADKSGFQSTLLITENATAKRLITELTALSRQVREGDTVLITFAGHGAQVPDRSDDEEDKLDETWCLYDRMLLDDELYSLIGLFPVPCDIVAVSDSCHSGTVMRALAMQKETPETVFRIFDSASAEKTFRTNEAVYVEAASQVSVRRVGEIAATVALISGCQDNQLSADGPENGFFTGTLLDVWRDGRFEGSYRRFYSEIKARMPPWQSPNLFTYGNAPEKLLNRPAFHPGSSRKPEQAFDGASSGFAKSSTEKGAYTMIKPNYPWGQDDGPWSPGPFPAPYRSRGNGAQTTSSRCFLEIDMDPRALDLEERDFQQFFDEHCMPYIKMSIAEIRQAARGMPVPVTTRSGSVDVECRTDFKGDHSCSVKAGISW